MNKYRNFVSRTARIGAAVLLGAAMLAAAPAAEAGRDHRGRGANRDRVVVHADKGKVRHVRRPARRDQHVRRDVLRYGYDYEIYRRDVRRRVVYRPGPIVVPHRIVYRAPRYDAYYWGRMYHRGHAHYHDVYRFPVRVSGGITYQAYAYCDGDLHAHGSFTARGPRFDLTVFF